jgi:hypothetical protein
MDIALRAQLLKGCTRRRILRVDGCTLTVKKGSIGYTVACSTACFTNSSKLLTTQQEERIDG